MPVTPVAPTGLLIGFVLSRYRGTTRDRAVPPLRRREAGAGDRLPAAASAGSAADHRPVFSPSAVLWACPASPMRPSMSRDLCVTPRPDRGLTLRRESSSDLAGAALGSLGRGQGCRPGYDPGGLSWKVGAVCGMPP